MFLYAHLPYPKEPFYNEKMNKNVCNWTIQVVKKEYLLIKKNGMMLEFIVKLGMNMSKNNAF